MAVVAGAAATVTVASTLTVFANDDPGLTLSAVADTTVTQVPQDGDTASRTTLASCPALCDGNPRGRRDATLQFAVAKLPDDATGVKAKLRVYSWHDRSARILARTITGDLAAADSASEIGEDASSVQALSKVTKGYNEFDVSSAVTGNGTYTFALSQEDLNTRVYWASRENAKESLRPQLVLSFKTPASSAPPAAPTTTAAPTTGTTAPTKASSAPAVTSKPPTATAKPTATATATPAPTKPPATTAPPTTAAPSGWKLAWSDEFNGSAIDTSKWNTRNNEARDIDLGCNTNSGKNQFLQDGNLILRAHRETVRCGSQNRSYTQGYLDTINKKSFKYGRFEMRAKSPNKPTTSKGLWPAFWLRPDDGGNGEIDVTELPGGADLYSKSTAAIFYDYTPVKQDTRIALPGGGYPGDGFHTYTTEWDATALKWYIDGKLVWTRDRTTTSWYDKAFNKPYNIRLNFQVGGWLGNPDANTSFPADFVVDYVRVYQR